MNSRKTFLILATHYMQLQNLILKLKHIQVQESLHLQHYSGRRLLTMKLSKNIQNMYGMMVKYRKKQLVQKKVQSYILVKYVEILRQK